ncbi:MAG: GldG family protein, partial [Rhodospirillales bacterium]
MRRLWFSIVGVLAAAGIALGINLFADARLDGVRIDLTQSRLYTLSDGTKQVLAGLKEPVALRLFYSRKLGATVPSYGTFADHVREMLRNYASLSKGKVKVEFYDPEPYSDTEDRAMAYGLQGVPVDQGGEQVWFGLVGSNLQDDERTIAFFQAERERFLEYDLTKLVYELSNPSRPTIGLMTSLPMEGDPRTMMMARQQGGNAGQPYASDVLLRQTNTVKIVPTDAQVIDADIGVLLVAQPPANISEATLYAIDQFVMRGGRLMAMVDPWSEAAAAIPNPTGMPTTDAHSDL